MMQRFRLVVCSALLFSSPWLAGQQYIATTIAGPGVAPTATAIANNTATIGDGGPATSGYLNAPASVVFSNGNLFILENGGQRVRQVTGGNITTSAGTGGTGNTGNGGTAVSATFNYPQGMAVDGSANIYVADTNNYVVRKFNVGGNISVFAGTGSSGIGADGGSATASQLLLPHAVALDTAGNVYIADGNRIRKVSTTGTISTIAGGINAGFAGDNGPAAAAQFNSPQGIAVDASGNIFIADTFNQRIRKISVSGTITTVAGGGALVGDGGPALSAKLTAPTGIAMDSAGAFYIAEHNRVRKVFPNGIITTIAGTGTDGYTGDGGLATGAQLTDAYGLSIDSSGNLYVADTGNNVVRMLTLAATGTATNAASNLPGPLSAGEIVTLSGTSLGPDPLTTATVDTSVNPLGLIGTTLNGVQVRFSGFAAPVLYESGKQVAAIVPYAVAGTGSGVAVQVINNGATTAAFTTSLADSAPEIFTRDGSGSGQAAALNQDGSLNSASNPAAAGSAVVLYVTGTGVTTQGGVDGQITGAPLPKPVLTVTATFGGLMVPVEYAGAAPGLVTGVTQVNLRLPQKTVAGNVAVKVTVGTATSQANVTIAVR